MDQLLTVQISNSASYFLIALLASFALRVYTSLVEGMARGREWFFPVFWGVGREENGKRIAADYWTGFLVGYLEAAAYPILLGTGHAEYLGAWLAFKTVNRMNYRKQDRGLFNRYLAANALLLFFGFFMARLYFGAPS
jgi:hypothetical protein